MSDGLSFEAEIGKDDQGTWRWSLKDEFTTTTSAGWASVYDALNDAKRTALERSNGRLSHVTGHVEWESTGERQHKATIYGHLVTVDLRGPRHEIVVLSDAMGQFTAYSRGDNWNRFAEGMARMLSEMESDITTHPPGET